MQPHVIQLRDPGPDSALQSTHCIFLFAVCRRQRGATVNVVTFDTVRVRAGTHELVSALVAFNLNRQVAIRSLRLPCTCFFLARPIGLLM